MTDWLSSRAQVSVGTLTAFGIEVCTRHNKAYELVELINFCQGVAEARLEDLVTRVFYDSNSCCCTFELCSSVEPHSEVDQQLLEIAKQTVGQFEWNGIIEHGAPLN